MKFWLLGPAPAPDSALAAASTRENNFLTEKVYVFLSKIPI
jgi:hypothetical protein